MGAPMIAAAAAPAAKTGARRVNVNVISVLLKIVG
jgi:hypothetical protein